MRKPLDLLNKKCGCLKRECTSKRFKKHGYTNTDGFINFLKDMGPRPSKQYSLDRIDNNKGYCKENCRWATIKEQTRNRKNNVNITFNNETKCISDWANIYNLKRNTISDRIFKYNWSTEKALTTPTKNSKNKEKSLQYSYDEMFKDIKFPIPNTHPLWKFINV